MMVESDTWYFDKFGNVGFRGEDGIVRPVYFKIEESVSTLPVDMRSLFMKEVTQYKWQQGTNA